MKFARRHAAAVGLLAMAVNCGGCTTFTAIDTSQAEHVAPELKVGSRIRVLDSAGERRTLKVDEIADDHLLAHDGSNAQVRVDFASVRRLERRDPAPAKTAGLVAGLVILVYGVVYAVAISEFLSVL